MTSIADTVYERCDKPLLTPALVFDVLCDCVGATSGMSAAQLVYHILGYHSGAAERQLRTVVEALRDAGHPICAHPSTGYFVAASSAELDRTCLFLYSRAMTSLKQVAAMKRVALPDLRGQLNLPLEGEKAA